VPDSDGKRRLARRYRIDGLLGQGGMSQVHYGYDERLDRQVAVKLLKPPSYVPAAPDSPEAAEILDALERDERRFLREIRVTAGLELPGVPAVYDTGVDTTDNRTRQLWLVMQLVRGASLDTLLRGASPADPPRVGWAAAIAAQVAAVLADVHQVDIVHRDIKPANIMVTNGGLVKVLDFGIAILRGVSALPRLTQIDKTVGTPAYMSPEQWSGHLVTPASDVYSLGCLLFEMLTGRRPFPQTDREALRVAHQSASAPSAGSCRAEVPTALSDLIAGMLAKEPTARPSAEAAYRALLPLVSTPAGTAPPDGDHRRNPVRPFRQPLLGVSSAAHGQASAGEAQSLGPLTEDEAVRLRADVQVLLDDEHLSEAVRLLESALARAVPGSLLELQMRRSLAGALLVGGQYGRAGQLFEEAGSVFRRHLGAGDPDALDCAYQAGHAYAQAGKPDQAMPQLRYYVQNAGDLAAHDADEAVKIMESRYVIAQLLASSGDADAALAEFQTVRPLLVAAYGQESTQVRNLDKQARRLS
jgi:serine/threonine protein kinase